MVRRLFTVVRATATIRAITATEATIGLFGGIDTTAGIMAAGAGTAGVMDGAGVMDTAAAGTVITDPLESLPDALGSAGRRALSRSLAPACLLAKKIPNRFRCRFLERFGIETLRKNFAMSQTCLASRCIVKLISVGIASGRHLLLDFNDRLQIVSSPDCT